jgi:hypothetical protein
VDIADDLADDGAHGGLVEGLKAAVGEWGESYQLRDVGRAA